MRTGMSHADRQLVELLETEGLGVSHAQLERWRQHGLLPRPGVVRATFGGSTVPSHPAYVVEAARVLSGTSARGRPWQFCAVELFDEGLPLTTAAMREAALYFLRGSARLAARRWAAARALVPIQSEDEFDIADVAFTAAELTRRFRSTRIMRSVVERDLRIQDPGLEGAELKEAVERALLWRLADLVRPEDMSEGQKTVARYGAEGFRHPERDVMPLPRDAIACAETLTRAEAYTVRDYTVVLANYADLQIEQILLASVVWDVASWRLNNGARDVRTPLGQALLQELYNDALDVVEQYPEDHPNQRQLPLWWDRSGADTTPAWEQSQQ